MIQETEILNARILIVDDHELNIRLLERILRNAGYTSIESTTNSLEVVDMYRKNRYNLILLDVKMPDIDGFQVLEGLKNIDPNDYLPVIMMTSHPEYKLRALHIGAKDFIGTPIDRDEVLARVHNMLEVRLLHEETRKHSKALEQELEEVESGQTLVIMQDIPDEKWI